MGKRRIVIDAVAFLQNLDMVTHLNLQMAGDDEVKFLSPVVYQMNRLVLGFFGILITNPVRFGNLILEFGGQVGNGDAFLPGG